MVLGSDSLPLGVASCCFRAPPNKIFGIGVSYLLSCLSHTQATLAQPMEPLEVRRFRVLGLLSHEASCQVPQTAQEVPESQDEEVPAEASCWLKVEQSACFVPIFRGLANVWARETAPHKTRAFGVACQAVEAPVEAPAAPAETPRYERCMKIRSQSSHMPGLPAWWWWWIIASALACLVILEVLRVWMLSNHGCPLNPLRSGKNLLNGSSPLCQWICGSLHAVAISPLRRHSMFAYFAAVCWTLSALRGKHEGTSS